MADYYQQFSVVVEFDSKEQRDEVLQRFQALVNDESEEDLDLCMYGVDASAEDEKGIWFNSEENGNLEGLVGFLHEQLVRLKDNKFISIEWANTCSKPRTDGFGGGAVVIHAKHGCTWLNTGSWAQQTIDRLSKPE